MADEIYPTQGNLFTGYGTPSTTTQPGGTVTEIATKIAASADARLAAQSPLTGDDGKTDVWRETVGGFPS